MYALQLYNTGCDISLFYSLDEIFSSDLSPNCKLTCSQCVTNKPKFLMDDAKTEVGLP